MKPGWPRRTIAFAVVLVTSAVASFAAALEPPATYCQLNPLQCHKLVGPTRMHFVGLVREALRAVPKVPGYRCHEDIVIDKTAYGHTARRAAPESISAFLSCSHRTTNRHALRPDVEISVVLSMRDAHVAEGGARETENGPLVFTKPTGVFFVFGPILEWRDSGGVIRRSTPNYHPTPEADVVRTGPFLRSAEVGIGSERREALEAFVQGFNQSAISALMAREARRRKADREFWGWQ